MTIFRIFDKIHFLTCLVAMTHLSHSMEFFGHRGASATAPENTLLAIEKAIQSGVYGVEFDVQLTQDNVVVLAHDDTLERVATNTFNLPLEEFIRLTTTPIAELSYAEILKIDIGAWKGEEFSGTSIPTLAQALELVPKGRAAMIDIKADSRIIPQIKELLKTPHCDLVLVSFSLELILELKKALPKIPCYYLLYHNQFSNILNETKELDGLSIEASPAITKQLANLLHERGQKLCVWVDQHPCPLDIPANYQMTGIDYFITNQPERWHGS
jgi:glycerophosphoryl diester phosphodiesterase